MSLDDLIARSLRIKAEGAAARGNGVTHLRSVPAAVERMALAAALSRVSEIEVQLEEARSSARSTARRAGASLENLFGETAFVPRGTAQRWRDEGRAAGGEQRVQEITRALQAGANPDPKFAAARAWGKEMLHRRRAAGFADDAELSPEQNTALLRGTLVAQDSDAAEAEAQARVTAEAKATADAIIQAGERARSDPSDERPLPGGLAGKILKAGERRRKPMGD
jgi:hypothetical protein